MKEIGSKHKLLILNLVIFSIIGFFLSYLLDQTIYSFASVLLGVVLGWLGEMLFTRLKITEVYLLRWILVFLVVEALVFVYFGIPAIAAYRVVHPMRVPIAMESGEIGLSGEEVTFTTPDGLILSGWYYPSQNGAAVVTVHGLHGNRTHPFHQAKILVENGYGVLTFDLRAHGESEGELFTGTTDVGLDVQGAVAYLQSKPEVDPERIGALGLSVGANAILYAAAQDAPIQALIADGTGMARTDEVLQPMLPEIRPFFFGIPLNRNYYLFIDLFSKRSAPPPIKEIVIKIAAKPILFIAGESEWLELALAHRYAEAAGENASVWLASGSHHTSAIFNHPREYEQRMLFFFDDHLLDTH